MINGNPLAEPGLFGRPDKPRMPVTLVAREPLMSDLESAPDPPALDAAALAKLSRLDPTGQSGLYRRVLSAYLVSLSRLRDQIDAMGNELDVGALGMAVHTLKSSSASVGALRLSGLCASIEQAARDGRLYALAEQVSQLNVEIERVEQAIAHMIAYPASPA